MFAKTNVILKQSKYHLYCQNNIVNLKYSIASRQGLKYFIFHFIYMRFRKRPPSFHRNFREYPLRVILFRFVICDICCKSFVFLPFKFVVAFIEKRQPEAIGTRVEKGRLKTCRNLLASLLACDHGIKKLLPAQPRSKPYMGIVSFVCKTWSLLPLCVIVPFILPIVM